MNEHPLTSVEASHLLADVFQPHWASPTVDMGGLRRVLAGMAVDGVCPARPDGVPESVAVATLDAWAAVNDRAPTPAELSVALDRLLCPDRTRAAINEARARIDAAKARRDQDHAALRRAAQTRRTA